MPNKEIAEISSGAYSYSDIRTTLRDRKQLDIDIPFGRIVIENSNSSTMVRVFDALGAQLSQTVASKLSLKWKKCHMCDNHADLIANHPLINSAKTPISIAIYLCYSCLDEIRGSQEDKESEEILDQ